MYSQGSRAFGFSRSSGGHALSANVRLSHSRYTLAFIRDVPPSPDHSVLVSSDRHGAPYLCRRKHSVRHQEPSCIGLLAFRVQHFLKSRPLSQHSRRYGIPEALPSRHWDTRQLCVNVLVSVVSKSCSPVTRTPFLLPHFQDRNALACPCHPAGCNTSAITRSDDNNIVLWAHQVYRSAQSGKSGLGGRVVSTRIFAGGFRRSCQFV